MSWIRDLLATASRGLTLSPAPRPDAFSPLNAAAGRYQTAARRRGLEDTVGVDVRTDYSEADELNLRERILARYRAALHEDTAELEQLRDILNQLAASTASERSSR